MKVWFCSSCKANILDAEDGTSGRCPWCSNVLGAKSSQKNINIASKNGATLFFANDSKEDSAEAPEHGSTQLVMPEWILEFKTTRQEAIEAISALAELGLSNAAKKELYSRGPDPLYIPVVMADAKVHAQLSGKGENAVKEGDELFYEIKQSAIKREFEVRMRGLPIKAACSGFVKGAGLDADRIITNISPYDIENMKPFSAEVLGQAYAQCCDEIKGADLREDIELRCADIVKKRANDSAVEKYNCGICWESQKNDVLESKQYVVYVPVWLFSYAVNKQLRYIAINGRTSETVGSVARHENSLRQLFYDSNGVESGDDIEAEFEVIGMLAEDNCIKTRRSTKMTDINGRNDWAMPSEEKKISEFEEERRRRALEASSATGRSSSSRTFYVVYLIIMTMILTLMFLL